MRGFLAGPGVAGRVIALTALAILCIGLAVVFVVRPSPPARVGGGTSDRSEQIARAVDSVLAHYGINRASVRTWQVRTTDKSFSRTEQRVEVGPEFLSVQFNHDLQRRLLPLGARVVATERARENIVTVHIVLDGVTIRSIAFLVRIPAG